MTDRRQAALRRLFARRIAPLSGVPGIGAGPSAGSAPGSYWKVRPRGPLAPADFELGLRDPAAFAAALEAQWRATPLRGLGRALARLARRFTGVREKDQVSSDVYEMF